MKHVLLGILLAGTCARAQALGRLVDVSIIDRDSGVELPTHYYKGEYWVAGTPGARYAISIRNHLGERVLAVTAVDGVNVVSGENAGYLQTGYVFDAYASYQIEGWRKTDAEVAAFRFAAASGAYATLTGRPANVGVIGVALFRERVPQVIAQPPSSRVEPFGAPLPAPPAASAGTDSHSAARVQSDAPASVEKLGTAHGEREQSYVSHTQFERQQDAPNELIRIRYDSLQNLIAMGIIRATPPPSSPNAFPESALAQHYVPDPPELR